MNILSWVDNHSRVIHCVALAIVIILSGILVWEKLHPPDRITVETQAQASTPGGAEKAAEKAQVPLSQSQAVAIATAIKTATTPATVVQTTGAKLKETVDKQLQKSSGDFAIVTDAKKPTSVPAPTGKTDAPAPTAKMPALPAIPANAPVTLNQYNIKAYPDHLIQIGGSYKEVFTAYSWKVTVPKIPFIAPHGDVGYLGFYGHANFDQPGMSRIGIMLTIPR